MEHQELLFNAASLLYLKDRQSVALPSIEKSHVGNARITLRSAGGDLLAHVSVVKAQAAISSERFGEINADLTLIIKQRQEAKAIAGPKKFDPISTAKTQLTSLLSITDEIIKRSINVSSLGWRSHIVKAVAIIVGGYVSIWTINYVSLQVPLNDVIASDHRNSRIKASSRYQWLLNSQILVFSIDEAASSSPADVSRILFQYASKLGERHFYSVLLANKGKPVFLLKGSYFKEIGAEYGIQNVIYTLRTMPENVYELDGSPAFSSWSGGWLGVMQQQFEDLSKFHRRWLVTGQ